MSHDKDREHPPPPSPKDPAPLASRPKPDCKRVEHPSAIPREPVDPRTHPSRGGCMSRVAMRPA
ncbi:MAG: hypothetical protein ACXWG3_16000 [Usitatibacter sp.]